MELIQNIVATVTSIIAIASIVCAMTETPKDDAMLAKFYSIVELLAVNIGKAKQ